MQLPKVRLIMAVLLAAAIALTMWPPVVSAAPYQLSCVLSSADESSAEGRSTVVKFDDDAKTLQAQQGGRIYNFADVSISNVAISGDVDSTSIGVDRSSFGLVWQQYTTDKVVTEYGQCRSSSSSSATR